MTCHVRALSMLFALEALVGVVFFRSASGRRHVTMRPRSVWRVLPYGAKSSVRTPSTQIPKSSNQVECRCDRSNLGTASSVHGLSNRQDAMSEELRQLLNYDLLYRPSVEQDPVIVAPVSHLGGFWQRRADQNHRKASHERPGLYSPQNHNEGSQVPTQPVEVPLDSELLVDMNDLGRLEYPEGCSGQISVRARVQDLPRGDVPQASLGAPCASLGAPYTSLGAPYTSLGAPCASLGAPCASMSRSMCGGMIKVSVASLKPQDGGAGSKVAQLLNEAVAFAGGVFGGEPSSIVLTSDMYPVLVPDRARVEGDRSRAEEGPLPFLGTESRNAHTAQAHGPLAVLPPSVRLTIEVGGNAHNCAEPRSSSQAGSSREPLSTGPGDQLSSWVGPRAILVATLPRDKRATFLIIQVQGQLFQHSRGTPNPTARDLVKHCRSVAPGGWCRAWLLKIRASPLGLPEEVSELWPSPDEGWRSGDSYRMGVSDSGSTGLSQGLSLGSALPSSTWRFSHCNLAVGFKVSRTIDEWELETTALSPGFIPQTMIGQTLDMGLTASSMPLASSTPVEAAVGSMPLPDFPYEHQPAQVNRYYHFTVGLDVGAFHAQQMAAFQQDDVSCWNAGRCVLLERTTRDTSRDSYLSWAKYITSFGQLMGSIELPGLLAYDLRIVVCLRPEGAVFWVEAQRIDLNSSSTCQHSTTLYSLSLKRVDAGRSSAQSIGQNTNPALRFARLYQFFLSSKRLGSLVLVLQSIDSLVDDRYAIGWSIVL